MGCDIHFCIQRQEANGSWSDVAWQQAPYEFDGATPAKEGIPIAPECFRNRNYDLFGILANVRNGYGFGWTLRGLLGRLRPVPRACWRLHIPLRDQIRRCRIYVELRGCL